MQSGETLQSLTIEPVLSSLALTVIIFPAAGLPPTRPSLAKLPDSLVRPQFDAPLLPTGLRFGSDPNLSQPGPGLLDPLASHRKMMELRPPGFPPTSGGQWRFIVRKRPQFYLNFLTASPSLYEMAALTSSLDTNMITTKVKEILLQHNVGQKVGTFFVLCQHVDVCCSLF